jgi:type IV secretory pathway VirJ component
VRRSLAALAALAALLAGAPAARASTTEKLSVRGQTLTLTLYPARGPARGTIIIGSGDVGWVGLAVSVAEEFSSAGYAVIGVNVRQYLASFTSGKAHLQPADVPGDFRAISEFAASRRLLTHPVVVSGVSEGAALAVLAASDARNHAWIDGVITMGLPPTAELAWRWSDSLSWITKRDANEPSFAPLDVIAAVAPLPLYMIQSKTDEYVTRADYERFLATARDPKQLVLIDASNHRFTDRRKELGAAFARGLDWVAQLASKPR